MLEDLVEAELAESLQRHTIQLPELHYSNQIFSNFGLQYLQGVSDEGRSPSLDERACSLLCDRHFEARSNSGVLCRVHLKINHFRGKFQNVSKFQMNFHRLIIIAQLLQKKL